ncbi:hypothetical protein ACNQ1X_00855 [Mycoplasma sp. SK341A]|uniref:hypothetical protein n=1 Tax=Mycoplasma sp. SK341A TaxID=3401679 RepID=UPI003AB0F9C6
MKKHKSLLLLLGSISFLPFCTLISCQQTEKSELNDNLNKINGIKELLWVNPNKNFDLDGLNKAVLKFIPAQDHEVYYPSETYLKSLNLIIKTINRNPKIYNKDGTINKTAWVNINLVNNYLNYMNSSDSYFIKKEEKKSKLGDMVPTVYIAYKNITIPLYKQMDLSNKDIGFFTPVGEGKNINFLQDILQSKNKINLAKYSDEHKKLVQDNRKYGLDLVTSLSLAQLEGNQKAEMIPAWNVEEQIFNKLYPNYEFNISSFLAQAWNNKLEFSAKSKDPEFNAPLSYLNKDKLVQAINGYTVQELSYANNKLSTLLEDKKLSSSMHESLVALKNSFLSKYDLAYLDNDKLYIDYKPEFEKNKLEELNPNVHFYKISIPVKVQHGELKPELYMIYGITNKVFINYQPEKHVPANRAYSHSSFESFKLYYQKVFSDQFDRYQTKASNEQAYIDQLYDSMKGDQLSRDIQNTIANEAVETFDFIVPLILQDNEPEFVINKVPNDFITSLVYRTFDYFKLDSRLKWQPHKAMAVDDFDKRISKTYLNETPYDLATLHNQSIPEIAALLSEK